MDIASNPEREAGDRSQEGRIVLVVRTDLTMPAEKLAVQAMHAVCGLVAQAVDDPDIRSYLADAAQAKIVKAVASAGHLERAVAEARTAGLRATLVTDAGRTVFDGPTLTVGAIGPCRRDQLPRFVDRLQLLRLDARQWRPHTSSRDWTAGQVSNAAAVLGCAEDEVPAEVERLSLRTRELLRILDGHG
jgi:PTH2 family peptidyl-tRNA hydrolase